MVKYFVMCVLVLCGLHCFAADTIVVHKDSRLDMLTAKQAEINKSALRLTPDGHYKGYRLLITTTRNRDEANNTKAAILQSFPDQRVYLSYLSPYYRVKVGNFITKDDAENFKAELEKTYDGGIYIVTDIVEYVADDTIATPAINQ